MVQHSKTPFLGHIQRVQPHRVRERGALFEVGDSGQGQNCAGGSKHLRHARWENLEHVSGAEGGKVANRRQTGSESDRDVNARVELRRRRIRVQPQIEARTSRTYSA
jgi:hypothetical protein